MRKEKWLPIKGYEGLYEISSKGRCKGLSIKTNFGKRFKIYPERILKPKRRKEKYSSFILCKNLVHTTHMIHRLVAIHFIPNPENKPCVNHRDGNKENNSVSNLEWVTYSENINHSLETGLSKNFCENSKISLLTNEQVLQIRNKYKPRVYTQEMLAKEYRVAKRTISHITQRTSWKRL